MTSKSASDSGQAVYRPANAEPNRRLQNGDDDKHVGTPPPYSGPSGASNPRPSAILSYSGLPALNYALYSPPNFKMSSDEITITTFKPEPNVYPAVLLSMLQSQSTLPPKVQIHIKGMSGGQLDFHVKINMMSLLAGDKPPSERWNYLKVIDDGDMGWRGDIKMSTEPKVSGGLDEWVRKYCADTSSIKQFTLERVVTNWDTHYIEARIHSLMASTSYRGQVSITFPMTHSKVTVHSPDKVNRLFTNMTHLFTGTKNYAVVKAVWPYASVPSDVGDRKFAVQSEERWWNDWKDAIRHAILSWRHGWVTVEDRLEFLMSPRNSMPGNSVGRPEEWGSTA